jgi:hypothetical protein
MASVAHSIETLLAQWLPPKTTNPPLAPTTSAFGLLDQDALLLIAHHLVPLRTEPLDWLSARDSALRNLNALVRSCRFWRDAFDGVCQSVRLEAIALASPCIPPAIARSHRPNGNVGALFEQLLAQAVHGVHMALLRRAAGLMVTHCTHAHCCDAVRALRSYTSNAFRIDARSDFAKVLNDVRLTRHALQGKCVQMHVAIAGGLKYGIVASQAARGGAPGGALLVAGESASDIPATNRRPSRLRPVESNPVFTYVESARSRVFSPDSELKKSATFRPGHHVACAAVCGSIAVLGLDNADDTYKHAIGLWSVTRPGCPHLSTGPETPGYALAVWAFDCTSHETGDYLAVYTLVQTMYPAGIRNRLHVRVVCYAHATGEWVSASAYELHLGSDNDRGRAWDYVDPENYGRHRGGVSLLGSVQPATESPVTSAALTVGGAITRMPHNYEEDALAARFRVLVVDQIRTKRGRAAVSLKTEVITEKDQPHFNENGHDATSSSRGDPGVHLSRCGTILVVLFGPTVPPDMAIYWRHPLLGWRIHRRYAKVDLITQGVTSRAYVAADSQVRICVHDRLNLNWSRAHTVTASRIVTKTNQSGTSAFSPCGKYLALLSGDGVAVIDVYEAICLYRVHIHRIPFRDNTAPYAIAWPDGLFVETSDGVWHIGTHAVDAPAAS